MAEEETYFISDLGESQVTPKEEGKEENFFFSPRGKIITATVAAVIIVLGVFSGKLLAKPGEQEAKTATAGAVVYSRAMKISAQPAEQRASRILGTVKKRIRMCGRPAVPIISEKVMKKTSIIGR